MSYYIPKKHPKDMTKDELFKTQQEIQKQEKARGTNFPLEVNARPANGEPATVKDMHEDATRKQLTNYYEQTAMAGAVSSLRDTLFDKANNKLISEAHKASARSAGRSGVYSLEQVLEMYGDYPEIRNEYEKGEAEAQPGVDVDKRAQDIKKEQGYK